MILYHMVEKPHWPTDVSPAVMLQIHDLENKQLYKDFVFLVPTVLFDTSFKMLLSHP